VEAHIEGTADFSAAQFEKEASFDGTHFSGAAIFQPRADLPVRFHGPALFRSTVYSDEANFERTQFLVESRFFGARFGQGVDFGQVLFGGRADFRACESKYQAIFTHASFRGEADFREAHFATVFFPRNEDTNSVGFRNSVDLRGFTYVRIDADWHELFQRLKQYDRQPFTQLESALRAVGRDQDADRVYLQRRREETARERNRSILYYGDWLFGFVAGYGIQLSRIAWSITFFIVLGTLIFALPGAVALGIQDKPPYSYQENYEISWNGMRLGKSSRGFVSTSLTPLPDFGHRLGQALAMSVHEFIPLSVSLGADWKPNAWWSAWYALFHRLTGGILLSLGVAALINLLHRRPK